MEEVDNQFTPFLRNDKQKSEDQLAELLEEVTRARSRRARYRAKRKLILCLHTIIDSLNCSDAHTVFEWLSVINDYFSQAEIRNILAYADKYAPEKPPLQLRLIENNVDLQRYPNVMVACLDNLEKNLKKRCKNQKVFYHNAALNNLMLDDNDKAMFSWALQLEPVYYRSLNWLRKIIFNWTHSAMKAVIEVNRPIHDVVRTGDVRIFKRLLAQRNSAELMLQVHEGETLVESAKRLLEDKDTGLFSRGAYKIIIAMSVNYFCKNWANLVGTREDCVKFISQLKALTPFQLKRVLKAKSASRQGTVLSCLQGHGLNLDNQDVSFRPVMESVEAQPVEDHVPNGNVLSKNKLQELKDKLWKYFTFYRFQTSVVFRESLEELNQCDEKQIQDVLAYKASLKNPLNYEINNNKKLPKSPYGSPLWHHISRKTLPRETDEKTLQKTINLDAYPRVKAAMDKVLVVPVNAQQWGFWKQKKHESNARKKAVLDATPRSNNNNNDLQSSGPFF